VNSNEFLITHLGPRHREAFIALVPTRAGRRPIAQFNDTLSGQDDGLCLCLVAETRDGRLLGVVRAPSPVGQGDLAADLVIAESDAVAGALLRELGLSLAETTQPRSDAASLSATARR
jgi:hypothetical protein